MGTASSAVCGLSRNRCHSCSGGPALTRLFCPLTRGMRPGLEAFWVVTARGCSWLQWVEAPDAVQHPTRHRRPQHREASTRKSTVRGLPSETLPCTSTSSQRSCLPQGSGTLPVCGRGEGTLRQLHHPARSRCAVNSHQGGSSQGWQMGRSVPRAGDRRETAACWPLSQVALCLCLSFPYCKVRRWNQVLSTGLCSLS